MCSHDISSLTNHFKLKLTATSHKSPITFFLKLAKPRNRGDGKQERTILLVNNTESPYKWSELLERTTGGLKYCQILDCQIFRFYINTWIFQNNSGD